MAPIRLPGPEKQWVVECDTCHTRTEPTSSRGAAICYAVLDGWSVGWNEYRCGPCDERRRRHRGGRP